MINTFYRTERKVKNKFKEFCMTKFGETIGTPLFHFFGLIQINKMNCCIDVKAGSERKIAFVSYLYKTYGIYNLLLSLDICYKLIRMKKLSLDTIHFAYINKVATAPDPSRVKGCDTSYYPESMSPPEKEKFKKMTDTFKTAFEYYIDNRKEIDSELVEVWEGDKKEVTIKKVEQEYNLVTPIQVERLNKNNLSEYQNYSYRCPVCNTIYNDIEFECEKCKAVFDYAAYKK